MRGRKPTPTATKVLNGNPGKRKLNPNEPRVRREVPRCPPHVNADKEAKAEWVRITKELDGMGLLSTADRPALAAYCIAWSRWVTAENFVREMGPILYKVDENKKVVLESGYTNPQLAVANRAMEQMVRMLAEFGLTPSSRSRVSAPGKGATADPFEILLNQKGIEN